MEWKRTDVSVGWTRQRPNHSWYLMGRSGRADQVSLNLAGAEIVHRYRNADIARLIQYCETDVCFF